MYLIQRYVRKKNIHISPEFNDEPPPQKKKKF